MQLLQYFQTDDGSLPEIEVTFSEPSRLVQAFEYLFLCGARDVTVGGGCLWLSAPQSEKRFSGPGDVALVLSGAAESFHVVLGDITLDGSAIPDLGVYVDPACLTFDYRMGPSWGRSRIDAFCFLLRCLRDIGGTVMVPWWGTEAESAFMGGAKWRLAVHSSGRLQHR